MTAPTTDAVAQARRELDFAAAAFARGLGATMEDTARYHHARESLIAAVRAECAAKVNPAPLTPFGEMVVKAVDGLQERIITAINDGRHTKGERSGLRMASAMVGELRRDLFVEAQP